jgi:hypothetical protein
MSPGFARQRRLRRWRAAPVIAGFGLLAVAGWGYGTHQPRLPEAGPAPVPAPVHVTEPAAVQSTGPAQAPPAPAVPDRPPMPAVLPVGAKSVRIPSLNVQADAVPESVHSGVLGVPGNPDEVGWWMPSTGELVLDGHVDMAGFGPGALFELRSARPGAAIIVQTTDGPERWTVDGVRTYRKGYVPAQLFTGTGPRLVVITCGGPFDEATHHYDDNVVMYASPS